MKHYFVILQQDGGPLPSSLAATVAAALPERPPEATTKQQKKKKKRMTRDPFGRFLLCARITLERNLWSPANLQLLSSPPTCTTPQSVRLRPGLVPIASMDTQVLL